MISKERFVLAMKFTMAIILLMTAIAILPKVFSRYQTNTSTNPNIDIAFYIVDTNYQTQNIILSKIAPSAEPYLINFTISNNDGTNRLETEATYDLKVVTTTNLPLQYELYKNQTYNAVGAANIITSNTVAADEDGMFFKTMLTATENFSYTTDQTNTYQLVIYFPAEYVSHTYQDIVDSIDLIIESRQLIDE